MPLTPFDSTPIGPTPQTHLSVRRNSLEDTQYQLSASTELPGGVRLLHEELENLSNVVPKAASLDPETRTLFHQRLKLCCIVAAFPFLFFFFSSLTGFIELFNRQVVGFTGIVLSGTVFVALLVLATVLGRTKPLPGIALRVLELCVFGTMGLFFAYFSFVLLTTNHFPAILADDDMKFIPDPAQIARQAQFSILAASLIVHFNWFALIVFHGVLVPNTTSRSVGVVTAMVLAALIVDGIAVALNEPTYNNKWVVVAVACTILPVGAGLAIFGTAKTAAMREEIQEAKKAVREMGQYRLRRRLGQGGMGEVFLAEHAHIKRPCALKRIHSKFLNHTEQIKRFEREVQTTAQLRHPNTVEVYDYGRADDGTFYYVMEYLPGLSLEEMVNRSGPLSSDRVVHLMRQVCGALREAHRKGLVHRDIKPSNVVVLPEGSPHDQAKLVDFGLVQALAGDIDPESKITRDGLIVGTPEYMSPEQAQGLTLDDRSDLFSLGSVMYFLLTGKEAFHRDNPVKTLLAVVNEEAIPVRKHNPLVPSDLAAVVAKCLSKDTQERYTTAKDLELALSNCGCANAWSAESSTEWWDRNPFNDATGTDMSSILTDD